MLHKIRAYVIRNIKIKKSLKIAIIVLALIGLADSTYLTYSHFSLHPLKCFGGEAAVVEVNSCQVVTESAYSTMLGIPVALIGMGFYLTVLSVAMLSLKQKYTYLLNLLLPFALLASLFSLRFIYLQAQVIGYLCYYCLLSALMSFSLLGISLEVYQTISEAD